MSSADNYKDEQKQNIDLSILCIDNDSQQQSPMNTQLPYIPGSNLSNAGINVVQSQDRESQESITKEEKESKKLSLNHEIIHDIFLAFLADPNSEEKIDEKALIKFMLSSKEAFDLVLKLLTYADSMEICTDHTAICFNNHHPSEKEKTFRMRFNSPMLKMLYPYIFSFSFDELTLNFDYDNGFIIKKFKRNSFEKIPPTFFKNLTFGKDGNISKNLLQTLFLNNDPPSRFSIPYDEEELPEIYSKNENLKNFSHIKKLNISGDHYCYNKDMFQYAQFPFYFAQMFPNLNSFNFFYKFTSNCCKPKIYDDIFNIDKDNFKSIPSNIKGLIEFQADGSDVNEDRDLNFINRSKTEMKFKETDDKIIVIKEFEIHEGLNFKFCAKFGKQ